MEQLSAAELAQAIGLALRHLAAEGNVASARPGLTHVHWQMVLYTLSAARTLREAIHRCAECFEAIDWRCGRMGMRLQSDMVHLSLDSLRVPDNARADCLVDLFGATEMHGLFEWLIGQPIRVRTVILHHRREVLDALGLPELPFAVTPDAGWTGFVFDAAYLDYPVVRNAQELETRPHRSLLFGTTGEIRARSDAERVREVALRALRDLHRLPSFSEVLATMAQSEATLRRRLAAEGTSYRQIRESCRRELAFDLLTRTTLSVEDIAARLDFCNSDALRHAFRKWAHTTPSDYRRQVQGA